MLERERVDSDKPTARQADRKRRCSREPGAMGLGDEVRDQERGRGPARPS